MTAPAQMLEALLDRMGDEVASVPGDGGVAAVGTSSVRWLTGAAGANRPAVTVRVLAETAHAWDADDHDELTIRLCEDAPVSATAGQARPKVLVILGIKFEPGADPPLGKAAQARLRRARHLAERIRPIAVIFSGGGVGEQSEAEGFAAAWTGPPLPLILEEASRTTAENALASLRLIEAMVPGPVGLRVVSSWWHCPRSLMLFRAADDRLGRRQKSIRMVAAGDHTHPVQPLRELRYLLDIRKNLREGHRFLDV